MFHIGPYTFKNRWILAPMAGVSEMPFRVIAREFGAALAPTELISAKGLVHKNERTQKYMRHASSEKPFMVQLFGGDEESMLIAAEHAIAAGADIIDINMGCPVPKVTKTGAGSSLLCEPTRAANLVRTLTQKLAVPVTCKIRAGWDSRNITCVEVAQALQDAGAAAIAIHPRTRAQGYSGQADWSLIARLREVLTTTTLIGNGDVTTIDDAQRMLEQTGCDAVMIGRAALGNPWIFQDLVHNKKTIPAPHERIEVMLRHLCEHIEFVGDKLRGVRQMRQHLMWYSRGLPAGKFFREQVVHLDEPHEVAALIRNFFGNAQPTPRILDDIDVNYQMAFG